MILTRVRFKSHEFYSSSIWKLNLYWNILTSWNDMDQPINIHDRHASGREFTYLTKLIKTITIPHWHPSLYVTVAVRIHSIEIMHQFQFDSASWNIRHVDVVHSICAKHLQFICIFWTKAINSLWSMQRRKQGLCKKQFLQPFARRMAFQAALLKCKSKQSRFLVFTCTALVC